MHSTVLFRLLALSIVLTPLIVLVSVSTPVYAASGTVRPVSGIAGSTVSVSGENFSGKLATIHWDDQILVEEVPISETGSLNCDLVIPVSSKGEHTILITDDSNWSASTASVIFTMLPRIDILSHIVEELDQITVTGKGFDSNETDIRITWDGDIASSSPVTANGLGTWYGTLTIPRTTKGRHHIGAVGSTTSSNEVDEVMVIVSPWVEAEPLSGPADTRIVINVWGFKTSEGGINITWDDEIVRADLTAEPNGTLSTIIHVPASIRGHHTISIYGRIFTVKGTIPDIGFEVVPQIKVQPDSGDKGTVVTVTGTGYAGGENIQISFDEMLLDMKVATDNRGSFEAFLTVPQSVLTEHTITAVDGSAHSAQADFFTEKTPPPAPQLLSPATGAELALFTSLGEVFSRSLKYLRGRVFKPSTVMFEWAVVNEPEGLHYILQVARGNNFSSPVLDKEIANGTRYTLSADDILPKGYYSWRVKAVDSVGNESPWSEVSELNVLLMPERLLIFTIAILVLFVAAVVLGVVVGWRISRM